MFHASLNTQGYKAKSVIVCLSVSYVCACVYGTVKDKQNQRYVFSLEVYILLFSLLADSQDDNDRLKKSV